MKRAQRWSHAAAVILFGGVAAAAPALNRPMDAGTPWPMHHIRDDYLIANSLQAGDLNQDGYADYAVIDEMLGLQTVVFHPGTNGDVCGRWPRVVLGSTGNPEYSCLGDLDGDGLLDLVVVEGDDLERGLSTGVRIWWGPPPDRTAEASAWRDAGHVPGTTGQQYLYCLIADLDRDGRMDILVGGRRHATSKQYAGIRWLRRPAAGAGDNEDPRNLTLWESGPVDDDALSGHGLALHDVDEDGDLDILNCDADWDTSRFDQELAWYENPIDQGPPTARGPWPKHPIWKSVKFYPKPQIGVGDLDGDGHADLATQTQNFIEVHRADHTHGVPVQFRRTNIMKPDWAQWIGRPVKIADMDGDGRNDVVAALIHLDGLLPADRASVFYLRNLGRPFEPDGWEFRVIKWSDGYNSRDPWRGEKWDHLLPVDVDGDRDLDLVGNVEEHFRTDTDGKDRSFFSLVWFENTEKTP